MPVLEQVLARVNVPIGVDTYKTEVADQALRAGASHNYLLVDGERRLTPREMLRLQGFPENFKIVCADGHIRKQAGNAVAVPVAERLMEQLAPLLFQGPLK